MTVVGASHLLRRDGVPRPVLDVFSYLGNTPLQWPWLPGLGLMIGLLTVAVFPEGRLPAERVAEPDLLSELSCFVLPLLGFLHVAYLAGPLERSQSSDHN
ncbi:hypothetical protein [Peristeroidobacter agariperforans]|uniref:hypothetical protein n=1 Tax=Peristeroidobacter agariperforans TaxID=268404 RepID=UPI00101D610E|nr:hypothetical protein [Peristeroidobacter agariperforans]